MLIKWILYRVFDDSDFRQIRTRFTYNRNRHSYLVSQDGVVLNVDRIDYVYVKDTQILARVGDNEIVLADHDTTEAALEQHGRFIRFIENHCSCTNGYHFLNKTKDGKTMYKEWLKREKE